MLVFGNRLVNAEQFYSARDQRTVVAGPFLRPSFPVAVVLAPGLEHTVAGQTALLWTTSMLRRMGRPFARTVIVTTENGHTAPYVAALHRDRSPATLGDAVQIELLGADPFAPVEWRWMEKPEALDRVAMVIRLGGDPEGPYGPAGGVWVGARGWVSMVHWVIPGEVFAPPAAEAAQHAMNFDSAPVAAVAAGAFATGLVYRVAQQMSPREDEPRWSCISTDTGEAAADPAEAVQWFERGSARDEAAPWTGAGGPPPDLGHLLLVSAGGIGGNAAQLLAASFARAGSITVLEPDVVDLPNLNRLIGVGVQQVEQPKLGPAVSALEAAGHAVNGIVRRYEEWSAGGEAERFTAPGSHVLVGVDQVASRLQVQADWPPVLINAGTSGTSWSVSAHARGVDGCVGCLYGTDQTPYSASRRALACGAGIPGPVEEMETKPDASYPFASVSAAAAAIGMLLRVAWAAGTSEQTTVARVNATSPAFGMVDRLPRHERCLLVCAHPSLDPFFGRGSDVDAAGRDAEPV